MGTIIQDGDKTNKHFRTGAKVYCYPPLWGDGYQKIKVIGRPKGSNGKYFVELVLDAKWIGNARVELVYEPFVIDSMSPLWKGDRASESLAQKLVDMLNQRINASQKN